MYNSIKYVRNKEIVYSPGNLNKNIQGVPQKADAVEFNYC